MPRTSHVPLFITERHIQALWLEQKYFTSLHTPAGEPITVISAGVWNFGAGPDFQKAHVCIAGRHYFGDIELHLTEDSWYSHHHHTDAHYNQVVLHIALWKPAIPLALKTKEGVCVSQAYLEPYLTVPVARLSTLIDLALYPYKEFVGAGKCARDVFDSRLEETTAQFFQRAADWRLQRKAEMLQTLVPQPHLYVACGIAMALGFKNNASAFLNLFLELRTKPFTSEEERIAWLLGRVGFFGERYAVNWDQNPYYMHLSAMYKQWNEVAIGLNHTQIRPLNHPIRRLVCMAKLASDRRMDHLLADVLKLWRSEWEACYRTMKWKPFLAALEELLPHYTDPYWNTHYLFEVNVQKQPVPLIGSGMKREMMINIIFPLLAQAIASNEAEKLAFQQLYRSLPGIKTGKTSYLVHRFFGDKPIGKLLNSAYHAQGAYQLHADYCFHFEASCEGCPFVEQHKAERFAKEYQPGF